MTKVCGRCGVEKDLDQFSTTKVKGKVYPRSYCILCNREAAMEWQARNKDRKKQTQSDWRDKNRQHVRESKRGWYARLPKEERSQLAEKNKPYRTPARVKEYGRRYYQKNKAKIAERARLTGLNTEKNATRRARKANSPVVEKVDRAAIIERDNWTCYLWCGRKLQKKEITLDHVIPLERGGTHTADNLRVACRSCNSRKKIRLLEELDLPYNLT